MPTCMPSRLVIKDFTKDNPSIKCNPPDPLQGACQGEQRAEA